MTPSSSLPVFIVDDSEDDLNLTAVILRKAGAINIRTAPSGEAAIEELSELSSAAPERLPFVVILDVKMPGLTGLELLEWIREHRAFDRIPVVMWSSSDDPRDLERAAKLGAQCYLGKYPPFPIVREMLDHAAAYEASASPIRFFAMKANLLHGRAALADLDPHG